MLRINRLGGVTVRVDWAVLLTSSSFSGDAFRNWGLLAGLKRFSSPVRSPGSVAVKSAFSLPICPNLFSWTLGTAQHAVVFGASLDLQNLSVYLEVLPRANFQPIKNDISPRGPWLACI